MANKKGRPETEAESVNTEEGLEEKDENTAENDCAECESEKSDFDKLKAEFESNKAFMLRLQADFENYKKRNKTLASDMYAEGKYDTLAAFLPVADSFDRALEMCSGENEAKGILLIKKQLDAVLEKLGAEAFGEEGEEFDPNRHNAVMQAEDSENKGKILKVMQKGYKIGDKIVRYAMVQVAV